MMLAWDRCRLYCRALSFKSSFLKLHRGVQRRAASPKVWWYQHTPETREKLWEREKDVLLRLDDLSDLPLCGVGSRLMVRTAMVSEIFCNTAGDVEAVGNGVYDVLCISITLPGFLALLTVDSWQWRGWGWCVPIACPTITAAWFRRPTEIACILAWNIASASTNQRARSAMKNSGRLTAERWKVGCSPLSESRSMR